MATLMQVHAILRPLKSRGTVNFFKANKLHICQNFQNIPQNNKVKLHNRFLYPITAFRFQSTSLDSQNFAKKEIDVTETISSSSSLSVNSDEVSNIVEPLTTLSSQGLGISSSNASEASLTNIVEPLSFTTENAVTTLSSQGLGGWWPPGLAQEYVNILHTSLDIPWWLAICTGTCIIRICLFPLVIKGQRTSANMANHMPQMQVLQYKMTEARKSGNYVETAQYANELTQFVQEKNINPLKAMILPLVQAPIFLSFFLGLRRMANLPMESMKDGGILWFQDLTLADPLYILPVVTSATLYLTIHFATDGIQTNQTQIVHYFLRSMPILIFPFVINFPTAILCYWVSSNVISLVQVLVLKIPAVRKYFNIPEITQQNIPDLPNKPKGFVAGFKETLKNSKITNELEDRQRLNDMQFRKAGTGPIPKTYKYDPTRQRIAKKIDK